MDEKHTPQHAARIKEGEYVLLPRGRHAAQYEGKHQWPASAVEVLNRREPPEPKLIGYLSDDGEQDRDNIPSPVLTQRQWEQVRRQMGARTKEGRPWTA
jgi:hypothetical protein